MPQPPPGSRPPQNQARQPQQRPAQTPQVIGGPPALIEKLPAIQAMHSSVDTLEVAMRQISARAHLLSPTVRPEMVPEFHEVSIRLVVVDPRNESGEVYRPQGAKSDNELALTKVALDRIAAAAGISWDPLRSGRLDDRSDPHYCHFRAVGYLQDLDGRRRSIVGEKEIDLRDGNPRIFTDRGGYQQGWSPQRLDGAREHILAMCESKAKNRATRSLGVKQKYTRQELEQKPFAVLALVLTGRSDDPELERMAKTRMLDVALQTSRELYGAEAMPPLRQIAQQLVAVPTIEEDRHQPPPVGAVAAADETDEEDLQPISEADVVCSCPDGPAGQHELGCQFQGASDGR